MLHGERYRKREERERGPQKEEEGEGDRDRDRETDRDIEKDREREREKEEERAMLHGGVGWLGSGWLGSWLPLGLILVLSQSHCGLRSLTKIVLGCQVSMVFRV